MIEAAQKANEQRWAVFNALQRDFLGTPPIFEDSVGVYLLKEDGRMQPLAPQSWINDANAHQMLASGRDVSGSLLIVAEASLPRCCPSMTPPIDAAPPQTGEQAHDSAPESVAVELTSAPPAPDRRSVKEPSPPGPVPKPRARLEELTPAASPIAVQGQVVRNAGCMRRI